MTSRYYTLDADHAVHGPFPFDGWHEWARRMENLLEFERVCRVGRTQVDGDCWVSTVFLRGIDHSMQAFSQQPHTPLLFETMVFGGEYDDLQERYSTWDEAAAGHQRAVDVVMGRRNLAPEPDEEIKKSPGSRRRDDDAAGAGV